MQRGSTSKVDAVRIGVATKTDGVRITTGMLFAAKTPGVVSVKASGQTSVVLFEWEQCDVLQQRMEMGQGNRLVSARKAAKIATTLYTVIALTLTSLSCAFFGALRIAECY